MFTECKKDELEQLFEKLLSDQEGAQTSEKKSGEGLFLYVGASLFLIFI